MKFFKLKSYHGTEVTFSKENRILHQSLHKDNMDADFILFRSKFDNDIFIGFPANLSLDMNEIKPDEVSLFKKRIFLFSIGQILGNKVSLILNDNGNYLSADIYNNISFDKNFSKEWELFDLEEVNISEYGDISKNVSLIDKVLSYSDNPDSLIYNISLLPENLTVEVFDLLLNFLSKSELYKLISRIKELFVRDILKVNDDYQIKLYLDKIISCFPFGWWVSKTIRDICDWDYHRNDKYFYSAGADYDFLGYGNVNIFGSNLYWGSKLIGLIRENIISRKNIAVLATARDEGLYFLEWLAHNKTIGVDHFFIYTNDNTDGSDELLKILSENKEITWIDNSGDNPPLINMQFKAYNHALNSLPSILDYKWCAIIDIDEVINTYSMEDKSIRHVVSSREKQYCDCITLSWKISYPNKKLIWDSDFSFNRFLNGENHSLVKSIFRTSKFNTSYAHHPECSYKLRSYYTCDGNKYNHENFRLINEKLNFCDEGTKWAYICHYHIRSLEEYVWKFSRGENDGNGVLKIKKFRYNNPGIFNLFLDKFYIDGIDNFPKLSNNFVFEFNRIESIPGVKESITVIQNNFKDKSLGFVEESASSIVEDERIDPEIKRKWLNLVDEWRKKRKNIP